MEDIYGDASDPSSSSAEQIRLDPYCVLHRYFRDNDDKGRKDKGGRG